MTSFAWPAGAAASGVTGPGSSTTNALAKFTDASGGSITGTGIIVDASNNMSGIGTISGGAITSTGTVTGTGFYGTGTVSSTGFVRLANNNLLGWRNAANNADVTFGVDGSDEWSFNGTALSTTELGYVAGVTSAIQTQLDAKLGLAGGTMTGKITLDGDPTNSLHAASKQYVDAAINGVTVKEGVKAASTANLTLSGEQTIDGVSCVADDRVLAKNQSTEAENGVYVVAAGAWSRAADVNSAAEINNALVTVAQGTTNANTGWYQSAEVTTLDTDTVTFVQFFGAGTYTADGSTLTLSGSTFSVANGGITPTQLSFTYPTVTVDNTVPRFDSTAGNMQTSGVTIDDSDNISTTGRLSTGGNSEALSLDMIGAGTVANATLSNTQTNYQALFDMSGGTTGDFLHSIGWGFSSGTVCAAINAKDAGGTGATGLSFATGTLSAISERLYIDHNGHFDFQSGNLTTNGQAAFGSSSIAAGTVVRCGGSGATSSTFSLICENSASTDCLQVRDDGNVYVPTGNFHVNSGKVGIGTTTPDDELHVEKTTADTDCIVKCEAASKTTIGVASAFRAFIGATGYGDFGSYNNGSDNAGYYLLRNAGGGTFGYFYMDSSRNLLVSNVSANIGTTTGTVVGTQTSDERLKTNISDLEYGLVQVKQLRPIRYKLYGKDEIGFGAQTTQQIVPEAVYNTGNKLNIEDENDPGDMLAMEYTRIVPVLTKAIQELAAKVEALESRA